MTKQEVLKQLSVDSRKFLPDKIINYLYNRGVTDSSIRSWEIGYLPKKYNISDHFSADTLIEYGIGFVTRQNKIFTPFTGRILFPIYNQYNELISITGRTLLDQQTSREKKVRKYWHNSFEKSKFLYGLNKAINAIRAKGYVIVGEGQLDTIIPHQEGIQNTISLSGTSLTQEHIALLSRYTDNIILCLDGDEAGDKAVIRSETKFDFPGINIHSIQLPLDNDIDIYVRNHGADRFLQLIEGDSLHL